MNSDKWKMYMDKLQGHPSMCNSEHTIDKMSFINDYLPVNQFNKILDIGCGEGLESKILSDLGYDVTGIIWGEVNEKYARENYPNINFVNCDMHDLPFISNSFDAIFMNQVFEHLYAPFIFLLEAYCVLRDYGRIWIGLPHFKEIGDETANPDINFINHHHPNILCDNLFNQYFTKTGFKVICKPKRDNPYFDNVYVIEKQPLDFSGVHSTVKETIQKRRNIWG